MLNSSLTSEYAVWKMFLLYEISENMSIVSAATEEQSATSHEIATASETLAEIAQEQQVLISHFSFNK